MLFFLFLQSDSCAGVKSETGCAPAEPAQTRLVCLICLICLARRLASTMRTFCPSADEIELKIGKQAERKRWLNEAALWAPLTGICLAQTGDLFDLFGLFGLFQVLDLASETFFTRQFFPCSRRFFPASGQNLFDKQENQAAILVCDFRGRTVTGRRENKELNYNAARSSDCMRQFDTQHSSSRGRGNLKRMFQHYPRHHHEGSQQARRCRCRGHTRARDGRRLDQVGTARCTTGIAVVEGVAVVAARGRV